MSKWHLFYNILGILDVDEKPPAAKLLGISSTSYSKLDVVNAFDRAQKKLRGNIPKKKLLHELLEFERSVLTPAMNELIENASLQSEIIGSEEKKTEDDKDSISLTPLAQVEETGSSTQESMLGETIENILGNVKENTTGPTQKKQGETNEQDNEHYTFESDDGFDKSSLLKYGLIFGAIVGFCMICLLVMTIHRAFSDLRNVRDNQYEDIVIIDTDRFQNNNLANEEDKTDKDKTPVADVAPENIGRTDAQKKSSSSGKIRTSEAIFSRLRAKSSLSSKESLNKTASALLSCCDRISKLSKTNRRFNKQLKRINLKRKVKGGHINIRLKNLNLSTGVSSILFARDLSNLKSLLNNGTHDEKEFAINRLGAIGSDKAKDILLEKLRKEFKGNESRATISKLINTLCQWETESVKLDLAKMIEECPRSLLASEISMKLTIYTDIAPSGEGIMPLRNTAQQREDCAYWWKDKLNNYQPKPKTSIANCDPNSQTTEILPQIDGLEILATAGIFMDMLANQLEIFQWNSNKENKYEWVDSKQVSISSIPKKFESSSEKIATNLLRITKEYDKANPDILKLDIIDLNRRVRVLASNSDLQKAVANLHASAQALLILNQLVDKNSFYKKALTELKASMNEEQQISNNSIEQLQQESYYTLRLLDLLNQQFKEHKTLHSKFSSEEAASCQDPNNY